MRSALFELSKLIIISLILVNSTNATKNRKSAKSAARLSKMRFFGKFMDFLVHSKPNLTIENHLHSNKRIEEKILRKDDFESIYVKWGRRPANFNCAWAPKKPSDRRHDARKLRIMSYNAEWLFLYGGSGSIQCPGLGCPWDNLSKARDHFRQTVDLLLKINADIVHLNEVEDCRVLHVLMDLLPAGHGYRAYLVAGTDTMTGQNVGILTRIDPSYDLKRSESRKPYPVPESTCGVSSSYISYSNGKKRSGTMGLSKHYLTCFQIGDMKISWAGAHFIAHPNSVDRCVRREAQAAVLAEFIGNEPHLIDSEVIITGDLNDHDEEVLGANNVFPLSSALRILKTCKVGLINGMSLVNDPLKRYTSWHDMNSNCIDDGSSEHSLIDHVLISPGLAKHIVSVWIDHNRTVSCENRVSDHWPIIIDFSF